MILPQCVRHAKCNRAKWRVQMVENSAQHRSWHHRLSRCGLLQLIDQKQIPATLGILRG